MIDLDFLRDRPVAVMGLGTSGLATARALARSGVAVRVWDDDAAKRAAAAAEGLPVAELGHGDLKDLALMVWSPGIAHTHPRPHPVAVQTRAAGIDLVCDIELLARAERAARFVGITGTNGKSTTTSLIGHVLAAANRPIAVGGNLGIPVLSFPMLGAGGLYVLEMSSYQLELTHSLVFDVSVLLNITADHLTRHGGMDGYIAAKKRIFRGQTAPRVAIVGVDDAPCRAIRDELAAEGGPVVWPVSAEGPVAGGVYAADGALWDDTGFLSGTSPVRVAGLAALPALPGRHNHQNAAAAFAACKALGMDAADIVTAMASFPGLAHRQQQVRDLAGVRFVNDSKATNADAAEKALVCYDTIYWILGGRPKEGGLDGLDPHMSRIRHAFLIGESSDRFARWLDERRVPYSRCGTLDVAVRRSSAMAFAEARAGACVLLSPACASWDQFANFEERGQAFVDAVEQIAPAEAAP
jgi:UDP-N-acetylmuramoylalanine--D-glutamate ligase